MAWDFVGTTFNYIQASIPPIDVPVTISLWFDSDATNVGMFFVGLASGAIQEGGSSSLRVGINSSEQFVVTTSSSNGSNAALSGITWARDVWNHGAGVFSSTAFRQSWLNGVTGAPQQTGRAVGVNLDNLLIGQGSGGTYNAALPTNGQLAEVAIWNVALSTDEIRSLYDGAKATSIRPESLVYYLPLIRDVVEIVSGITLINQANIPVDHPRRYG